MPTPSRRSQRQALETAFNALAAGASSTAGKERGVLEAVFATGPAPLVVRAAKWAAANGAGEVDTAMAAAFHRFLHRPVKTDPGCMAKNALTDALNELGTTEEGVFLAGIHHVQREPVFGGSVDTAATLRGNCAAGLARLNHPDVLYLLTDLLFDPEVPARRAAVQALGYLGGQPPELILRAKVRAGDPEPDVIERCLAALVQFDPGRGLAFAAPFLDSADPALEEAAAFAIAEAKSLPAWELLRARWDTTLVPDRRRALLLPMALLRLDEATEFVSGIVASGDIKLALAALEALALYRGDPAQTGRIRNLVDTRQNADLSRAFAAAFMSG